MQTYKYKHIIEEDEKQIKVSVVKAQCFHGNTVETVLKDAADQEESSEGNFKTDFRQTLS